MVKILKNQLLRNQEADDLETWYTSGTQVQPIFFQMMTLSLVGLDHFYDMVKFVS